MKMLNTINDTAAIDINRARLTDIISAPKGTQVVYHAGLLAEDRGEANKTTVQAAVDDIAKAAVGLYEKGFVKLVQKRLAPFLCEYIAIRTALSAPHKA
jgi:hypothetical protein